MSLRQNLWRMLERLLNIISVGLIAYICVTVGRAHLRPKPSATDISNIPLGQKVPLDGVHWETGKTLVFALSTGCHFCTASAPFYQRLLKTQGAGKWHAIAVLPQSVESARAYMSERGYNIPQVVQLDLSRLGITATPTLLLVDSTGTLEQEWVGQLGPTDENDVAEHLGVGKLPESSVDASRNEATLDPYSPFATADQFLKVMGNKHALNVVDVRDRPVFAVGHIETAVNIPTDELEMRAPHELLEAPTFLYCNFQAACEARGVTTRCSLSMEILKNAGFSDVHVIRDPLPLLKKEGVPITGTASF